MPTDMWNIASRRIRAGFTLVELLVTIAVIGILAGLLLPVLSRAKNNSRRATCLNNLRQINVATRMYFDEHEDAISLPSGVQFYADWVSYKPSVKYYLGLHGPSAPSEKIFMCPADTFSYLDSDLTGGPAWKGLRVNKGYCEQGWTGYNSYAFNGGNSLNSNLFPKLANPGIAGIRLTALKHPAKTLLVFEASARLPFSWHRPEVDSRGYYQFGDSMNMLGFADGHVNFCRMYWNGALAACMYDPPAGYDYQWSGN